MSRRLHLLSFDHCSFVGWLMALMATPSVVLIMTVVAADVQAKAIEIEDTSNNSPPPISVV